MFKEMLVRLLIVFGRISFAFVHVLSDILKLF